MILDELIEKIKQGRNIMILGNDVDKISDFYSKLNKETENYKDNYYINNFLNVPIDRKRKFVNEFNKNKKHSYLILLKTKLKMPNKYFEFNIYNFLENEFEENIEIANTFSKFDCFYMIGDNYTYFVNEK